MPKDETAAAELVPAAPAQTEVGALALITLSPEKYAAEVYQPFVDRLKAAIASVKHLDFDITTTAGMAAAVKARATFRDLRIEADKERKARKAPIISIGTLLESDYNNLEARITPLEDLFDADIQGEVKRKATAKAEAERIAAERLAALRIKINAIIGLPARSVGLTAAALHDTLAKLAEHEVTVDEYAELLGEAQIALDAAGSELATMYTAAKGREDAEAERVRLLAEEQARIEAQAEANRIEAARLKKLADDQAERERVAADTKRQLEAQAEQMAVNRRDEQRRNDQAQAAMAAITAIQQLLEVARAGRPPLIKGGDSASYDLVLSETRAWEITEELFGAMTAAVQMVKDATVQALQQGFAIRLAEEVDIAHGAALAIKGEVDAEMARLLAEHAQIRFVPQVDVAKGPATCAPAMRTLIDAEPAALPGPESATETDRLIDAVPAPHAESIADLRFAVRDLLKFGYTRDGILALVDSELLAPGAA